MHHHISISLDAKRRGAGLTLLLSCLNSCRPGQHDGKLLQGLPCFWRHPGHFRRQPPLELRSGTSHYVCEILRNLCVYWFFYFVKPRIILAGYFLLDCACPACYNLRYKEVRKWLILKNRPGPPAWHRCAAQRAPNKQIAFPN